MADIVLDAGLIEMNKPSFLSSKILPLNRRETGVLKIEAPPSVISK